MPPAIPPTSSFASKSEARSLLLMQRRKLHESMTKPWSAQVVEQAKAWPGWHHHAVVGCYWPLAKENGGEPDLTALYAWLVQQGHQLALPTIMAADHPMAFQRWQPGDALVQSSQVRGLWQPAADQLVVMPSLLLIPAVAIDRRGYRLGFGAGYYDRTLAALRAEQVEQAAGQAPLTAVGVAFRPFWIDCLPNEPHDQRLQAGVHEDGWVDFAPISDQP
jgi:5-formyltetrahydrofolate cyclo-ligase